MLRRNGRAPAIAAMPSWANRNARGMPGPWLMPASEQVPAPSILGVPNLSPRRHGKRPRISWSPTHHVRCPERPRIPWADSAKAAPTSYPLLGRRSHGPTSQWAGVKFQRCCKLLEQTSPRPPAESSGLVRGARRTPHAGPAPCPWQ